MYLPTHQVDMYVRTSLNQTLTAQVDPTEATDLCNCIVITLCGSRGFDPVSTVKRVVSVKPMAGNSKEKNRNGTRIRH